jgi:hypothetical protein
MVSSKNDNNLKNDDIPNQTNIKNVKNDLDEDSYTSDDKAIDIVIADDEVFNMQRA